MCVSQPPEQAHLQTSGSISPISFTLTEKLQTYTKMNLKQYNSLDVHFYTVFSAWSNAP